MEIDSPKKTQPELYNQLVNVIAENRPVAMIGAGSSIRMGYPSWDGVLKLLSAQAAKKDPSKDGELASLRREDPMVCADKIKKLLGDDDYYSQLEKIFGPVNPEYDVFHELVIRLPFGHFLTTNYDRILQTAHKSYTTKEYAELDLEDHQKCGELFDLICGKAAKRYFIHAHGSIRNPKNMILALEDYNERYEIRNDLKEVLKCVFTRRVVFIGFSLEDEDFMGPLKFLTSCLGIGEPRHFAILPAPSDKNNVAALRDRHRARYRIESLFYDPRDDHAILVPFLEELVADVEHRQSELIREKIPLLKSLSQEQGKDTDILSAIQNIESITRSTIDSGRIDITSPDSTTRTALDSEIDTIFSHVKNGHPEIAIEMYGSILEHNEDSLDERLKYRLHANIGNALNSMNKREEASREYIAATDSWNATKEAEALRALGYVLTGDYESALDIAGRICSEHPDYPRAHALRLQSLRNEVPFKEARKSVPPRIRRDPEVAYALSVIAHEQGLQKRSEVYAKIAWQNSPDWTGAALSYATALLVSERNNATVCGGAKLVPRNIDRVREAESVLTGLLAKLEKSDPADNRGIVFYNRATARRLLGLDSDTRSDIEQAFHHSRNNPDIVCAYVLQREQDSGHDQAIHVLDGHEETQNHPSLSFLLSHMLLLRSNNGDLERALSILMPWCEEIETVTPASLRYDVLRLISEILLKMDRAKEAVDLVNRTEEPVLSSSHRQMLLLRIKIDSQTVDINDAKRTCEEVAQTLGSLTKCPITWEITLCAREIALCADRIKHYPLSFELWKNIVTPQDFSQDTDFLLRAAQENKNYEFIIDFCEQLRQNEIHVRNGYVSEIQANIQCHEFDAALNLMVAWVNRVPNDKEMRLNLSLLASETDNEQYIESDPDKLPAVEEAPNAEYGTRIIQAMKLSGNACATILCAYELWRKFSDELVSQRTLIVTVLDSDRDETLLEKPEEVKSDSAVVYKATDSDDAHTHIIEVGPSPSMAKGEYSPDHEISRLLLGKKAGDSILVNGREWSILEINSKYVHTTFKLLRKLNMDFPGDLSFREFTVTAKSDSSLDPQEALGEVRAYMQDEENRKKTYEESYQEGSLSVTTFAKLMGKSVLETMAYLAASPKRRIRVCSGTLGELEGAVKTLKEGCRVVLDETAIATLFMLGLHTDLREFPYELIVPESLILEIRRVIRHAVSQKRSSLYLGISNGNLVAQRVSPTEHANWINSLEELLVSVKKNCTIEGGRASLGIESTARENLIQNLGPATVDALAIAKKTESMYWTDDLLCGSFASELQIRNIWSQVALQFAADINRSFVARYHKAQKNMFLWGYTFTAVQVHTIFSVCIDARWNVEDYRMKYVLEYVGKFGGANKNNCRIICALIVRIWLTKSLKRRKARKLIALLLDRIGRSTSGPQIARKIYRNQFRPPYRLPNNQKIRSLKHMLRDWRTNHGNVI